MVHEQVSSINAGATVTRLASETAGEGSNAERDLTPSTEVVTTHVESWENGLSWAN
jgi:hypothetical protein